MAIAFDAASTSGALSSPGGSWSHTVGSGDNRVLYVGLVVDTTADPGASATYNGVSMDKIVDENGDYVIIVFRMTDPPTGTNTVAVSWGSANNGAAGAVSYSGVDLVTPNDAATTTSGNPIASVSKDISSASGDLVIDFLSINNSLAGWTAGANQTSRFSESSASDGSNVFHSEEAGAATVTMSHTWTNADRAAHTAFNLNAATASGHPASRRLGGVHFSPSPSITHGWRP